MGRSSFIASGVLFALVVVLKLIGMAIGDIWSFTATLAQLPWWPHILGAAVLASMIPWWPGWYSDDPYFSAVGLKTKLIVGAVWASVPAAMKQLDVLTGLGAFDDVGWWLVAFASGLLYFWAWIPYSEHGH